MNRFLSDRALMDIHIPDAIFLLSFLILRRLLAHFWTYLALFQQSKMHMLKHILNLE